MRSISFMPSDELPQEGSKCEAFLCNASRRFAADQREGALP